MCAHTPCAHTNVNEPEFAEIGRGLLNHSMRRILHFARLRQLTVQSILLECVDEGLDGSALFPSAIIILVIFFIIAWHW